MDAGTTVGTTPAELAACCTWPRAPRQQQQGSLCCQQPSRRCMRRPRYQPSSTAASGGKRASCATSQTSGEQRSPVLLFRRPPSTCIVPAKRPKTYHTSSEPCSASSSGIMHDLHCLQVCPAPEQVPQHTRMFSFHPPTVPA